MRDAVCERAIDCSIVAGAEQIKLLAEWLATSEAQKMAVRCSDAACHGGRCRLGVATYVHVSNDGNTRGSGL